MFKEYISDENMINMAAEVARSMDPELYEKGKNYYNCGRVDWAKLFGPRIYSVVDDGKKNTVIIHINDFSKSTCTCVKKHFCEHIAAVFLHYYEPWLMSNEILSNINSTLGKKTSNENSPLQLKNQVLDIPVTEEGPVERWYEYFEREYGRLKETPKKYYQQYMEYQLDELYYSDRQFYNFIATVSVHSNNWPSLNRNLYRLHSILFFMTRLEKSTDNVSLSYMGSYQIERIEEDFMEALDSVMSVKRREKFRSFFQKAVELVRENFLREKEQLFAWIYIYRLICDTFLDSQGVVSETACLEELMRGLKENQQGYYYAALGLACLKMSAHRSDDALAVLQKLKEKRFEDMFFYLQNLAGAKEWEKLLVWLRWLDNEIKAANPVFLEGVCDYCILAAKNSQAGDEFIKLVKSWLPRSFDSYAGYLLAAGLFREWVELNISYGIYWQSINKGALRHLESREPAVLIPLYHQWAARLIEEKNRRSYREAVRLLKKLRGLYNKQKMGKEWNTFIARLASRYPRMRAFQEELRKGKLIS
ncbi:SWIM zinc finger family protein [Pelotomaculum propionicicum]|uniref:SWIM-type domain-containing protein n=1 Tax=Pelotomaculum propionicicum TaxID=258475 RepID=A0A4Y7RTU2_9FIRM|nr:SWIM zinc finger family protein [Pelotomaculum propionicicum]NLI13122.1 SWIM zinc finger family protein [Peptococcaceae bacterium]TEB12176.1 hypothetical protein Pmgp_01066 [Pelotomaculum propionicicum]